MTMTNHSLCALPCGLMEVREGREGGLADQQNPPLQSAVGVLRVPTCVFMLVLC